MRTTTTTAAAGCPGCTGTYPAGWVDDTAVAAARAAQPPIATGKVCATCVEALRRGWPGLR